MSFLKAMRETLKVSTQAAVLLEVFLYENAAKNHDCFAEKRIMNLYVEGYFYTTLAILVSLIYTFQNSRMLVKSRMCMFK